MDACAKFGFNLHSGSGGGFLSFVNVFSLHAFYNYLPLEKVVALHLYKFEFSSLKVALC